MSCEAEASCNVKLARTKGKVVGCSPVNVGLTSLFGIGPESVGGVERGAVGAFNSPEGFPLKRFKSKERLMYSNTNIIAKMRHHCIVPPISARILWNMLPIPTVQSLTACLVDSIILEALSHPGPLHHSRYHG